MFCLKTLFSRVEKSNSKPAHGSWLHLVVSHELILNIEISADAYFNGSELTRTKWIKISNLSVLSACWSYSNALRWHRGSTVRSLLLWNSKSLKYFLRASNWVWTLRLAKCTIWLNVGRVRGNSPQVHFIGLHQTREWRIVSFFFSSVFIKAKWTINCKQKSWQPSANLQIMYHGASSGYFHVGLALQCISFIKCF